MKPMARVALTAKQKQDYARKDFFKALLDGLNAKRGMERKSNREFAEELGVSAATWSRWNNGYIESAEIGMVVDALLRVGMKLEARM